MLVWIYFSIIRSCSGLLFITILGKTSLKLLFFESHNIYLVTFLKCIDLAHYKTFLN